MANNGELNTDILQIPDGKQWHKLLNIRLEIRELGT